MVYYWHYAAEMHLPAASLDALAAGRYRQLVRAGAATANGRASWFRDHGGHRDTGATRQGGVR